MRSQTVLGRMLTVANEPALGVSLFFLRLAAGAWIFSVGMSISASFLILKILLSIIGLFFVLGLSVRLASFILGLLLIGVVFLAQELFVLHFFAWLMWWAIVLLGFFGGLGHAFGLNGLIFSNIRQPGFWSRLFFL